MLMSAADYRESLRRYRPVVYVDGQRIDSVADEPLLAPGVNGIGVSYDFALRESTQGAAADRGPRFRRPDQPDAGDSAQQRGSAQQARGGAPRVPGDRVRAALPRRRRARRASTTARTALDAEANTDYHARLIAYLEHVYANDLARRRSR